MCDDDQVANIPWIREPVAGLVEPFRNNVKTLLKKHGEEQDIPCNVWRGRAWTMPVYANGCFRQLHVYEDRLDTYQRAGCEQCRCNGWQHHPVSNRKYHFILPTQARRPDICVLPIDWDSREGGDAGRVVLSGISLESKHHILHGVVHSNGFGHLLRINGLEGGSNNLTGREVMHFWDGLCSALRVRSISIEDVSNKRGMLLRILYAAAHRKTWYGEWEYRFGRAGYNIQEADWLRAVDTVNSAPLQGLLEDFRGGGFDSAVIRVVERYRGSNREEVETLGDWLKRVMDFSNDPNQARDFFTNQDLATAAPSFREDQVPAQLGELGLPPVSASALALPALAQSLSGLNAVYELAGLQVFMNGVTSVKDPAQIRKNVEEFLKKVEGTPTSPAHINSVRTALQVAEFLERGAGLAFQTLGQLRCTPSPSGVHTDQAFGPSAVQGGTFVVPRDYDLAKHLHSLKFAAKLSPESGEKSNVQPKTETKTGDANAEMGTVEPVLECEEPGFNAPYHSAGGYLMSASAGKETKCKDVKASCGSNVAGQMQKTERPIPTYPSGHPPSLHHRLNPLAGLIHRSTGLCDPSCCKGETMHVDEICRSVNGFNGSSEICRAQKGWKFEVGDFWNGSSVGQHQGSRAQHNDQIEVERNTSGRFQPTASKKKAEPLSQFSDSSQHGLLQSSPSVSMGLFAGRPASVRNGMPSAEHWKYPEGVAQQLIQQGPNTQYDFKTNEKVVAPITGCSVSLQSPPFTSSLDEATRLGKTKIGRTRQDARDCLKNPTGLAEKTRKRSEPSRRGRNDTDVLNRKYMIGESSMFDYTSGAGKQPVTVPPKAVHKRKQANMTVNGDALSVNGSGVRSHHKNTAKVREGKQERNAGATTVNGRHKQKQKQPASFNGTYQPPTDLVKPAVKPFDPKSLLQGPRNWSAHKLVEFLKIVLGVLQTIEGQWVKLQELRDLLYATAHDRVLADWVLGRLANTTFADGYVVYKTRSESGRRNFFLFEGPKGKKSRSKCVDVGPSSLPLNGMQDLNDLSPSMSRFKKFLTEVFDWLCANPHVQVGKPTVSKRPPAEPLDRSKGGTDSEALQRVTRSRTENAIMRELKQLKPEKGILETPEASREKRKRSSPGDQGANQPHKKSRGLASRSGQSSRRSSLQLRQPRIQRALDMPDVPWLHGPRSAVDPFLEALERKGAVPGDDLVLSPPGDDKKGPSLKDQIMADLVYVYQNVLESYMPLFFVNGEFNTEAASIDRVSQLKLDKLPGAVQVLMDTKLFIKDYDNDPTVIPPQKPGDPRLIRLMCEVDIVPELPKGYKERSRAGIPVKLPSFFTRRPPAMAVYVPQRCDMEEVKRCVAKAFKDTYLMFSDWSVLYIHGLRFGGRKSRLMPVEPDVIVKVKGKDIHNEPEYRHAGCIEDWEVSCRCGAEDDDGERMVACDGCGVWMHIRCAGFCNEGDIPEQFQCLKCAAPKTTAGESQIQQQLQR